MPSPPLRHSHRQSRSPPLGGVAGEFCPQDRAPIFDDPNGTRILYDPGRTVAGANDSRLGKIDIILVSHMHGDHAGNAHQKEVGAGTCDMPDVSVSALPNTSVVNIAVAKKSKIVTGSEMPLFFAAKLKANGGKPATSMLARFGGSVTVGGVRIATVTAMHSNGVDPDYIGPVEAAYVVNELVKPATVIASHANDVGTVMGKVRPGSKTEAFIKGVKVPVHIPRRARRWSSTATPNARLAADQRTRALMIVPETHEKIAPK